MSSPTFPPFVFFGTSAFAVRILDALAERGFLPSFIVTTPDAPAGRGLALQPPPAKEWAETHGVPVFQPEMLKSPEVFARLAAETAGLFIVAAYGKLIPRAIFELPLKGTLNIHPSLLPRWRGADPIRAAILADDAETGVTVIRLDEKMDHGPIVTQSAPITIGEKICEELESELADLGGRLLADTIPRWIAGEITPQEQRHAEATFTKKITKDDGHLNWNEPAEQIARKIRALNPRPGTYAFWNRSGKGGKNLRIRILSAQVIHSLSTQRSPLWNIGEAGVVRREDSGLAVGCADGALRIEVMQMEGKRPIPSAEFAKGYPDIVGAILE